MCGGDPYMGYAWLNVHLITWFHSLASERFMGGDPSPEHGSEGHNPDLMLATSFLPTSFPPPSLLPLSSSPSFSPLSLPLPSSSFHHWYRLARRGSQNGGLVSTSPLEVSACQAERGRQNPGLIRSGLIGSECWRTPSFTVATFKEAAF